MHVLVRRRKTRHFRPLPRHQYLSNLGPRRLSGHVFLLHARQSRSLRYRLEWQPPQAPHLRFERCRHFSCMESEKRSACCLRQRSRRNAPALSHELRWHEHPEARSSRHGLCHRPGLVSQWTASRLQLAPPQRQLRHLRHGSFLAPYSPAHPRRWPQRAAVMGFRRPPDRFRIYPHRYTPDLDHARRWLLPSPAHSVRSQRIPQLVHTLTVTDDSGSFSRCSGLSSFLRQGQGRSATELEGVHAQRFLRSVGSYGRRACCSFSFPICASFSLPISFDFARNPMTPPSPLFPCTSLGYLAARPTPNTVPQANASPLSP